MPRKRIHKIDHARGVQDHHGNLTVKFRMRRYRKRVEKQRIDADRAAEQYVAKVMAAQRRVEALKASLETYRWLGEFYTLIGLEPTFDFVTVHAAWKRAMVGYHPDHEGGNPRRATRLNELWAMYKKLHENRVFV